MIDNKIDKYRILIIMLSYAHYRSTVLSLSSVLNICEQYFAAATSYRPIPELILQLFIKFEVTIAPSTVQK